MNAALTVSSSPHIHDQAATRTLMRDVLIALAPALAASVILFGWRSALLTGVCVASSVLWEYLFRKLLKRSNTIGDLSAVVTGVILAFNLPVTLPLYMGVIGSAVAIIVVKEFFGGLGKNIANPALVGRIVLLVSFPLHMTNFTAPLITGADFVTTATPPASALDFVTTATPLVQFGTEGQPTLLQLFLGVHGGCLGETCALALLLGGIYLLIRKVITWHIPVFYIGTVAVLALVGGQDPLYAILTGGLFLGAFFMATDYVNAPLTSGGKIAFGVGCGLMTYVIRTYCALPEGVSYAILLMDLLNPTIERLFKVRALGDKQHG